MSTVARWSGSNIQHQVGGPDESISQRRHKQAQASAAAIKRWESFVRMARPTMDHAGQRISSSLLYLYLHLPPPILGSDGCTLPNERTEQAQLIVPSQPPAPVLASHLPCSRDAACAVYEVALAGILHLASDIICRCEQCETLMVLFPGENLQDGSISRKVRRILMESNVSPGLCTALRAANGHGCVCLPKAFVIVSFIPAHSTCSSRAIFAPSHVVASHGATVLYICTYAPYLTLPWVPSARTVPFR
jgi:hypothetical protein